MRRTNTLAVTHLSWSILRHSWIHRISCTVRWLWFGISWCWTRIWLTYYIASKYVANVERDLNNVQGMLLFSSSSTNRSMHAAIYCNTMQSSSNTCCETLLDGNDIKSLHLVLLEQFKLAWLQACANSSFRIPYRRNVTIVDSYDCTPYACPHCIGSHSINTAVVRPPHAIHSVLFGGDTALLQGH